MSSFWLVFGLIVFWDWDKGFDFSKIFWIQRANKKVFFIELLTRFIWILMIWLVIYLLYLWKNSSNIASIILQILCLIIFFLAKKAMKENREMDINWNQKHLTKTWIFSYSRNPTFVAFHFLFLSFLFIDFWYFAILYLFFAVVFHTLILEEEKHLEKKFRKEFIEYKKKVKRYF